MTQSHGQLMRSYIDLLNESDQEHEEEFWAEFDRVIDPSYEDSVQAALEDAFAHPNHKDNFFTTSDDFIKICDQHDVDPGDVAEIMHEVKIQQQDERNYDHWGKYDRDPDGY